MEQPETELVNGSVGVHQDKGLLAAFLDGKLLFIGKRVAGRQYNDKLILCNLPGAVQLCIGKAFSCNNHIVFPHGKAFQKLVFLQLAKIDHNIRMELGKFPKSGDKLVLVQNRQYPYVEFELLRLLIGFQLFHQLVVLGGERQ